MDKLLYKITVIVLKILPMLLAFITLLNSILSYFNIDLVILSYIGGVSLIPILFIYITSYTFKFCEYHRKGYRDSDDNILAKLNEAAFGLYKYNRDSKDAVEKRISDIETKLAVNAEADKWRDKVLSMQINGVNANAENLVALERERRQCADNKIVNYVNSTFYPVSIADVTTGTTTTKASTYNPLCGCTCIR